MVFHIFEILSYFDSLMEHSLEQFIIILLAFGSPPKTFYLYLIYLFSITQSISLDIINLELLLSVFQFFYLVPLFQMHIFTTSIYFSALIPKNRVYP